MNKPNDGGPAFPLAGGPHHADGMALRDYFAGIALPVVMENDRWLVGDSKKPVFTDDDIARAAYAVADAMMRARDRKPKRRAGDSKEGGRG